MRVPEERAAHPPETAKSSPPVTVGEIDSSDIESTDDTDEHVDVPADDETVDPVTEAGPDLD